MHRLFVILAVTVIAAACSTQAREMTAEEVEAELNKLQRPIPGLWQVSGETTNENGNSSQPQPVEQSICVTPEMASMSISDQILNQQAYGNCKYSRVSVRGSNYTLRAECTPPQGGRVVMDFEGSAAPDHSRSSYVIELQKADGTETRMRMTGTSRRIGACSR